MKSPCFRPASEEELPRILEIIRQAQRRMAAAGSRQWQDGYPASEHIANDLKQGYGWVLTDDDEEKSPIGAVASMEKINDSGVTDKAVGAARIVAYGAVVFDGEPAYEALDGHWLTNGPYVVVHRLAVADEALGQGFGTEFLKHVEQLPSGARSGPSASIPISIIAACCGFSTKADSCVVERSNTAADNVKPSKKGSKHPGNRSPDAENKGPQTKKESEPGVVQRKKRYLRVTISLKKSSSEMS